MGIFLETGYCGFKLSDVDLANHPILDLYFHIDSAQSTESMRTL